MPDKLTDSEIVKAWEYCATKGNCSSCFLKAEEYCTNILKRLTIDLFNRLQEENERLKEVKEHIKFLINSRDYECLTSEIYNEDFQKTLKHLHDNINIKAEAYKEFAELLHCQCEGIINQPHNENVRPISWKVAYEEFDEKVDNLLKEMVGDSNEVHNSAPTEN